MMKTAILHGGSRDGKIICYLLGYDHVIRLIDPDETYYQVRSGEHVAFYESAWLDDLYGLHDPWRVILSRDT